MTLRAISPNPNYSCISLNDGKWMLASRRPALVGITSFPHQREKMATAEGLICRVSRRYSTTSSSSSCIATAANFRLPICTATLGLIKIFRHQSVLPRQPDMIQKQFSSGRKRHSTGVVCGLPVLRPVVVSSSIQTGIR